MHHPTLDSQLAAELSQRDDAGLLRRLRPLPHAGRHVEVGGRTLLNLAGNDYLGLADHPVLKQAAAEAVGRFGVGSGASRLVTGHLAPHAECEAAFATFKHAEAALLFCTGYTANLAVLTALAGPDDLVCQDRLNHASLIDAARFSGATVRTYPHGNRVKLERLLAGASTYRRRFIVTDSVFSMDGDVADLPTLCDLADRHDATLIVDEAHGTGVLGATGAGLIEHQGVVGRVPVVVSTASKALGGLGGIVTASRPVIETLQNHARSFIYSTAPPPAQAAAITAALGVLRDEPWRRDRLAELSRRVRTSLSAAGWPHLDTDVPTPIVPLHVGDNDAALALAAHLETRGILAVAIRPPTVPPNTARVRLSLRADLTDDDVDHLLANIGPPSP